MIYVLHNKGTSWGENVMRTGMRIPQWKTKRFGEGFDLYLNARWLGSVGPDIDGECRFMSPKGSGTASCQAEAKRCVEAEATQL